MATSWRAIHLAAYREAMRAHDDLSVDLDDRIDPFAALVASDVIVIRRALQGVAGIYLPANADPGAPAGVLVNLSHPDSKQRYTAAHELSHHRRDRAVIFDRDTEWLGRAGTATSEREQFAEAFAAWFLMPGRLVRVTADRLGINLGALTPASTYRLSLDLGTSYRATVNHLKGLRLVTSQLHDSLINVSPASIKEAFGLREVVENLRRDVWHVGPGDAHGVRGTAGDVVAVDLAEVPSSGYEWRINVPGGLTLLTDGFTLRDPTSIGGEGAHRFLVRIDTTGDALLRLEQRRAWEPQALDAREVEVHATARPTPGLVDLNQLTTATA